MNTRWNGSKKSTKLKYLMIMTVLKSFQDIKINLAILKKVRVMETSLKIFQKMGTSQWD